MKKQFLLLVGILLLTGCSHKKSPATISTDSPIINDTVIITDTLPLPPPEPSETELRLQAFGLINIHELSPEILVDLKYATADNFTKDTVYTDLTNAYLVTDVAERLSRVQNKLSETFSGYKLLIYDAARPLSAQRKLFDKVRGTANSKYVASPSHTGLHNYGVAVDLTIADSLNRPIDMGTGFDHFGIEAHTTNEAQLVAAGKLTQKQVDNRLLLRKLMREEGFRVLPHEWWHFNGYTLRDAKAEFKLLDF